MVQFIGKQFLFIDSEASIEKPWKLKSLSAWRKGNYFHVFLDYKAAYWNGCKVAEEISKMYFASSYLKARTEVIRSLMYVLRFLVHSHCIFHSMRDVGKHLSWLQLWLIFLLKVWCFSGWSLSFTSLMSANYFTLCSSANAQVQWPITKPSRTAYKKAASNAAGFRGRAQE